MPTNHFSRRNFIQLSGCSFLLASSPSWSEDYPQRPIKLVIPQGPGSGADATGRQLADFLSKHLGTSVVVDNKPGANGILAASLVSKEKADGYSIFLSSVSIASFNQHLYRNVPFDALQDFSYIAPVADASFMIIASKKSGIRNWDEFIAAAQKSPDTLTFASGGLGNSTHLYMEKIASDFGLKMRHIPYKGSGPALLSIVSGETDVMCVTTVTGLPQMEGGKVTALAQTGSERSPRMSNIPLLQEVAPSMPSLPGWYALVGPANLPSAITSKLSQAVQAFLQDPSIHQSLKDQFLIPIPGSSADVRARAEHDSQVWGSLIQKLAITLD